MLQVRKIAKLLASEGFTEAETCEFCFAFLSQSAQDKEESFMVDVLTTLENKMMSLKPSGELYD
jgi:Zn-dependent M16 (insulinase) family peptidase